MKKMFFISGLPRSGSTLLSALLSQNPDFYSEGHSSLCQILWDTQQSCLNQSLPDIKASGRNEIIKNILSSIPKNYYYNIKNKYIFDKSSYWTHPNNFEMIKKYIDNDPKIIVLVRDVKEVLNSFLHIHKKNNSYYYEMEKYFLYENNLIINAAVYGTEWALQNNKDKNFLFIDYNNLCINSESVMKNIYNFLNIDYFKTNFSNIQKKYEEDDSVYGINNLHYVRSILEKEEKKMIVNQKYIDYCNFLNSKIEGVLRK